MFLYMESSVHSCCWVAPPSATVFHMSHTEHNVRRVVQHNPTERGKWNLQPLPNCHQRSLDDHITIRSLIASHTSPHFGGGGGRLKRQLIDRQCCPGKSNKKNQQGRSNWWEMFTSLTSAQITSEEGIFFKAPINQTYQNVYHCVFLLEQTQTKLQ